MVKFLINGIFLFLTTSYCRTVCIDSYNDRDYYNQSDDKLVININVNEINNILDHFWENTGFCPPDPHSDAFTYMLSSDMHHNLALIGSVPHNGIKQIRIHYLLKLIQVDVFNGQFEYNFTYLDQLITLLRNYNLKPGFELMGNPSNIYNDFENKTQIIQWKEMVQQMIRRYIKKFGLNYIKQWNFESWNEPSIEFKHYFSDNIKVTPKGFLNYYDSCSLAIKEIDNNLVFGGPGDHWPKDIKNGSFVIDLINHFINGSNFLSGKKSDIKLDYLSLHEKGSKGQSSYTDYLEDKALNDISYYFNTLKNIPFVNNEGDPEVGWNRNRTWRADNRYAATIVQSVARHIYGYNYTNKLSQFAFDNAFLSYYPYQFTQRTLLARFQINNTKPHFTQFIKKPALSVMGLLSKLGDHLLHFKSNVKSNSTFNIISSAYFGTKNVLTSNLRAKEYSILIVNSLDTLLSNKTNFVKININFEKINEDLKDWKWTQYIMDNIYTNPFDIWKQNNCPDYPSDYLFRQMRDHEEPYISVNSEDLILDSNVWSHSFEMSFPSISLIQICRKTYSTLQKIYDFQGIHITNTSVLFTWISSNIRCLKTYEIEFSKNGYNKSFNKINNKNIIFSSFQYTVIDKSDTVFGYYRLRAIDFWDQKSEFSDILNWKLS